MRKLKWMLLVSLSLSLIAAVSCDNSPPPTLPPATPGGGFVIESFKSINGGPDITEPSVEITSNWQADLAGASGDPTVFTVITSILGLAPAVGKRAPAKWQFTWVASADDSNICDGKDITLSVQLNGIAGVVCEEFVTSESVAASASAFSMSPNPVFTTAPPSAGTITGTGFNSTYGMPLAQYYTLDGTLISQENATSVSSDGTQIQISGFSTSQLPIGTYAAFVSNAASGGTYTYLGTGAVQVANGGVFIDGWEQSTQVCHHWLAGGDCQTWVTVYDSGTVSITINGVVSSVYYSNNSTSASLAIALAGAINSNTSLNTLVTALVTGTTVMINTNQPGMQYSLSAVATSGQTRTFPDGSFAASASGPTL